MVNYNLFSTVDIEIGTTCYYASSSNCQTAQFPTNYSRGNLVNKNHSNSVVQRKSDSNIDM